MKNKQNSALKIVFKKFVRIKKQKIEEKIEKT